MFKILCRNDSPLVRQTIFVCADPSPDLVNEIGRLGCPVLAKPFAPRVLLQILTVVASAA